MSNSQLGKAIFLNGPSSSGKTCIAKSLQKALTIPYMHIGIDTLIAMMPAHLNDWEGGKAQEGFWWKSAYDNQGNLLQHIQLGPYAKKISEILKEAVVMMMNNGLNVIVDEVCIGENDGMRTWRDKLSTYDVLYVGVNASVETLEAREKERTDRIAGSARAQSQTVHQDAQYDIELDTDKLSIKACVARIIKNMKS